MTTRPATQEDCVDLARTLRSADRAELAASTGASPIEALSDSLRRSSHAVTAVDDRGRIICMFGVGPIGFMSDQACAWMLGSDLLELHWVQVARRSRGYLAFMLSLYPWIVNAVDARQAKVLRWLRWLGANVHDPVPIGRHGAPFCVFEFVRGGHV